MKQPRPLFGSAYVSARERTTGVSLTPSCLSCARRCGACASRPSPSPPGFSLKHGPHIRWPRRSPEHTVAAPGVLRHEPLGQERVGVTVARRSGVGQPLAAELVPLALATKHTSHDRQTRPSHRSTCMVADTRGASSAASVMADRRARHRGPSAGAPESGQGLDWASAGNLCPFPYTAGGPRGGQNLTAMRQAHNRASFF